MGSLNIKRVYDEPKPTDGYRVLVDRLWPRGETHERAAADVWLKEIAPSPALRTWWNHDPDRLDDFSTRYEAELDENPAVGELLQIVRDHDVVTLLYGARDPKVNHARVLRDYLLAHGAATDE
ncbi:DUF488 domain-containing protein [Agromyces atrinae]|uniref:Uncharacterized protein YeaO (DUF488 family) n=1 Tax=Agromyces atrinae TaxID=592376 RepID=A0A852SFX8_9MICO|nr:DUF488 family protein [Agromyces atrinae]NYD67813.1 uncharacterized protein YeaO (DUF488 family) [Agromyces atrinae]